MALSERDKVSGHMTTGHEWNGIKELNTPVPRVVYIFLISATIFSVTWTILMPSWPGINDYFRGLLGADQQAEVRQSVAEGVAERSSWTDAIVDEDFTTIRADPSLMQTVRETGKMLFAENCAACHGAEGLGNPGFPNIIQAPTMWGDDPATIMETIRVGINSAHDETRYGQMLAFGRDQMLPLSDVDRVVTYVQTLSDPAIATADNAEDIGEGATIFADNCAACHGETGTGMQETGAPNLTDQYWIYGGDRSSIRHTVYYGRQGLMPTWEGRLTPAYIKLLALYVADLRTAAK
ncbi:cytochrome-c oxidase, cbb3-type subunit III [Devosia rhodophyticola]|uniref:Cbb3-type cytochrome c oxidase subunit n=1 Tax=Devosia rhodophyticola TaxID=3026423 RepID=A0ABY7YY25_9HYPH|nr:cytochrome-c oxidase, cbb3-type subunit III [Devosia rhodophyticola]WDR06293.1 cytochrome-c oxidase, cbb3-type subunit III [Devosia rhodophyticola]